MTSVMMLYLATWQATYSGPEAYNLVQLFIRFFCAWLLRRVYEHEIREHVYWGCAGTRILNTRYEPYPFWLLFCLEVSCVSIACVLGLSNSCDKQRLEAFLLRYIRVHLSRQHDITVTYSTRRRQTFHKCAHERLTCSVLHPCHNNHTCNAGPRRYELTVAIKGDARNFLETQSKTLINHFTVITSSYL